MKIQSINLLFVLSSSRKRKDGKAILYCRITYLKKRSQFSTGLFINPKHWNSKHQKAEPPNDETEFINSQLSLIKSKINKAFLLLQVQEGIFAVDDIHMLYKGKKPAREHSIVEQFESYLNMLKKLVGIDIKQATWNKFYYVNTLKSS